MLSLWTRHFFYLTLTSVVFESTVSQPQPHTSDLTLTSVVFELKQNDDMLTGAKNLTLTSVVFELDRF